MTRVLLNAGRLAQEQVDEILGRRDDIEIVGIIVEHRSSQRAFQRHWSSVPVVVRSQLATSFEAGGEIPDPGRYSKALEAILTDPRVAYLNDRNSATGKRTSYFNDVISIENIVSNCLALIDRTKPDRVVFQATPHHVINYTFARTVEASGVPVLFTGQSILPGRCRVLRGIDEQSWVPLPNCLPSTETSTDTYLESVQSVDYGAAMPDYERRRNKRYRGKYWNTGIELRRLLFASPRRLHERFLGALDKARCLRF